jgi:aryl-alcohol dehydrogenase-like predicted oxidoreductase
MAKIILGTVQFGVDYGINNTTGKPTSEAVFKILSKAWNSGICILDTAEGYGDAVDIIGAFHRESGIVFEINTKFTYTEGTSLAEKLETTIQRLGVTYIGTYFYHSYKDFLSKRKLIGELLDLKKQKLVQRIGLSVYTNDELQTAIDDPAIDVIQMPFNLLDNYSERGELLRKAKAKNKRVQVRSVFLQGLFFKDIDDLPVTLLPLLPYLKQVHAIAAHSSSIEMLCLQYAAAQEEIDEIIIGVDTEQQLSENTIALNKLLSPQLRLAIDAIKVKETELLYPYNWV